MSGIFGGGGSKSSSATGYSALPSSLQGSFNDLGTAVGQYTNPNNPGVTSRFTQPTNSDQQAAYSAIRQGVTPTASSLQSDLSMLMNPFNDSVIGGINNQANSNFSILKQNMDQAGQFGSNRQQLGANDIELQRQNQIGSLLQNQYNTALGQIFNNLVPERQQDLQNLLNSGNQQSQIAYQNQIAPISALQAGTSMISPFTAGGTMQQTTNPNILGNVGGLASGLGTLALGLGTGGLGLLGGAGAAGAGGLLSDAAVAAPIMSDINMKERIIYLGKENGHNVYEYSYKGQQKRYIGVMAQEVAQIVPEAVISTPLGLMVDYSKINVEFREAA